MTPETEEMLIAGLAKIQATLQAQNETLEQHTKTLDALTYTLNGNGVPGLKQVVASHESTLAVYRKAAWIVGTPLLAAAGGGLLTLIVWGIRHIPAS